VNPAAPRKRRSLAHGPIPMVQQLGYIEDAALVVTGERVHSRFVDLRTTITGNVAKQP
jgi:hypothetical protein